MFFQATLSVCGSNRQCPSTQHCRFVARADSVVLTNTAGLWHEPAMLPYASLPVVVLAGNVALCSTAGLCHQPTVLSNASLLACVSSRQWCLQQLCQFMAQPGSALFTIIAAQWSICRILLFHIYLFIFVELGFALLYLLHRPTNPSTLNITNPTRFILQMTRL